MTVSKNILGTARGTAAALNCLCIDKVPVLCRYRREVFVARIKRISGEFVVMLGHATSPDASWLNVNLLHELRPLYTD
jgi:hypothetical protein